MTTDYGGVADSSGVAQPASASSIQDGVALGQIADTSNTIPVIDYNFQDMLSGKGVTSNVGDLYYFFYGVQRVGLACHSPH